MQSSGIRLVLVAATVAVVTSWVLDSFRSGVTVGSTGVALGMLAVFGVLFSVTYVIDNRSRRKAGAPSSTGKAG